MMERMRGIGRWLWPGTLTPAGLAMRGVSIGMVVLIMSLMGMGESVSILSGTSPDGQPLNETDFFLGAVYVLMWLLAVAIAPILIMAGGMLGAWERMRGGGNRK